MPINFAEEKKYIEAGLDFVHQFEKDNNLPSLVYENEELNSINLKRDGMKQKMVKELSKLLEKLSNKKPLTQIQNKDIVTKILQARFKNNYGKFKSSEVLRYSELDEVELFLNKNFKELYELGLKKESSWTVFVEDSNSKQNIEETFEDFAGWMY